MVWYFWIFIQDTYQQFWWVSDGDFTADKDAYFEDSNLPDSKKNKSEVGNKMQLQNDNLILIDCINAFHPYISIDALQKQHWESLIENLKSSSNLTPVYMFDAAAYLVTLEDEKSSAFEKKKKESSFWSKKYWGIVQLWDGRKWGK